MKYYTKTHAFILYFNIRLSDPASDMILRFSHIARVIQLFRYFTGGKKRKRHPYFQTNSLKSKKKVENKQNLKFSIKYLQKPGGCGNGRRLKMSLGQW